MTSPQNKDSQLYIGAMSGTSADAIDVVLVNFGPTPPEVLAQNQLTLSADIRQSILDLSSGRNDALHDMLLLDRQLAGLFAEAVNGLLQAAGVAKSDIRAIGSHGQTLRHQTGNAQSPKQNFTLQVADPNTIAEHTGIDVVADFRRRDIAAGGEAAPMAPGFHHAYFSHPDRVRAIVNIGGFCNVTLLVPGELPLGFDTGPGNCLLDGWIQRHLGEPFDRDGGWAVQGRVDANLLTELKAHPYFARPAPKSTGRETFNLEWLDSQIGGRSIKAEDVQATLMQLTVETLFEGIATKRQTVAEIYLCGGGAKNAEFQTRIASLSGLPVGTTTELGIDPQLVEACAFAWMARQRLERKPGNLPSVTGAAGPRLLGGVYCA